MENGTVALTAGDHAAAQKALDALAVAGFYGRTDNQKLTMKAVSDVPRGKTNTSRRTTVDEVNAIFREEAGSDRYRGVLGVTEEALVSSDTIQDPRASIVDLELTQVVDGNLVKVMSWHDNEWGYTSQMIREAIRIAGASKAAAPQADVAFMPGGSWDFF